ncbi:hypothetical protein DP939_20265 [Spongiactinospora rosea]|uniref:AMP-binding enzyme C-terminal domain-containing protein n=1 Tax=Spongiactinospora rosea TaxID=2248750 RepID=A0A366LXF2_9ACTN|nr:hypothetical protein [Spongiactinospora rosea]RBQ18223.1 hypothetical protein DP939_20265 [Spongiactinospora rosea]
MPKESRDYTDVERALRSHPRVAECAVTRVETAVWETELVAYVVAAGKVRPAELRQFLAKRLPQRRLPAVVALVDGLPRMPGGEIDYESLPQPAQEYRTVRGGKGGAYQVQSTTSVGAIAITTPIAAVAAFLLTNVFWPYSTDLTAVPQPWASLFFGLYLVECVSFGIGVGFLLFGYNIVARARRGPVLTVLTHLAITWLLASWWPQDNFYRLTAKTDWPAQAALVYIFNVTLMLAAIVVVVYVANRPAPLRDRLR